MKGKLIRSIQLWFTEGVHTYSYNCFSCPLHEYEYALDEAWMNVTDVGMVINTRCNDVLTFLYRNTL